MKTARFLLRAFWFASLAAAAVAAQAASTAPTKSPSTARDPERFAISWTRSRPMALDFAHRELEQVSRRARVGNASQDEVEILATKVAELERQAAPLITVTSKGGPLGDFIAVAARSEEVSLTLINAAEPADLNVPIPPFELRNVGWETVINVLGSFLNPRGLSLKLVGSDLPNTSEAKSVICTLNRTQPLAEIAKTGPISEFESIQLVEHLGGAQTVEVIVDAIRSAWELDPAREPAALRLKFHPGTKLLLASGPAPTSLIVRQVVAGLQKNPVQR